MQNFLSFLVERRLEIFLQTLRHLEITLISLAFAIFLGVLLGILLTRIPKMAQGTLGFLGIIQTIPSLALLGFMLPVLGIGAVPAIIALFLYALLPIVRNTYTGIIEVNNAVIEAAKGMGLSSLQILLQVELPLAIPIIFAGIRTAVVINVGIATLCALIAAGGLGEFIFRGIALNNANMILAGAIPSALLALSLDSLLALLQKYIQWILKPLVAIFIGLLIFWAITEMVLPTTKPKFRIGMEAEFMERADGYKGLLQFYGIKTPLISKELDAGLMYNALKEGKVDIIAGYSTDGRIKGYELIVLDDNKFYFPPYYAAPLVNEKTLAKYPILEDIFNKIADRMTDEVMRNLNFQVDAQRKTPTEVAKKFLQSLHLKTDIRRSGKADIIIGGKKFTEQYILLEIFKLLIENYSDLTVELKSGLGGTQIAFSALQTGEIDIYPEYTGTALFVLLKTPTEVYMPFLKDARKVYAYVKQHCKEELGVVFLAPLGFNNTYALMMREKEAKTYNIRNISDLKKFLEVSY